MSRENSPGSSGWETVQQRYSSTVTLFWLSSPVDDPQNEKTWLSNWSMLSWSGGFLGCSGGAVWLWTSNMQRSMTRTSAWVSSGLVTDAIPLRLHFWGPRVVDLMGGTRSSKVYNYKSFYCTSNSGRDLRGEVLICEELLKRLKGAFH